MDLEDLKQIQNKQHLFRLCGTKYVPILGDIEWHGATYRYTEDRNDYGEHSCINYAQLMALPTLIEAVPMEQGQERLLSKSYEYWTTIETVEPSIKIERTTTSQTDMSMDKTEDDVKETSQQMNELHVAEMADVFQRSMLQPELFTIDHDGRHVLTPAIHPDQTIGLSVPANHPPFEIAQMPQNQQNRTYNNDFNINTGDNE